MAQLTTGCVYECEGHRQEGHELAAQHPVVIVGRQSLIDNQGIAIVVPLTSTRPNYPVHWAVEIEDTNSYAYIRHVKSVHTSKIGRFLGQASREEIDSIKDGLARELQYANYECTTALGLDVCPGSIWSAAIPNARGLNYEGELLILTSNRDTRLVTALAVVDSKLRQEPRQSVPVRLQEPERLAFAITYQVRSISGTERLTGYRGEITDEYLRFAKSALIRCIGF